MPKIRRRVRRRVRRKPQHHDDQSAQMLSTLEHMSTTEHAVDHNIEPLVRGQQASPSQLLSIQRTLGNRVARAVATRQQAQSTSTAIRRAPSKQGQKKKTSTPLGSAGYQEEKKTGSEKTTTPSTGPASSKSAAAPGANGASGNGKQGGGGFDPKSGGATTTPKGTPGPKTGPKTGPATAPQGGKDAKGGEKGAKGGQGGKQAPGAGGKKGAGGTKTGPTPGAGGAAGGQTGPELLMPPPKDGMPDQQKQRLDGVKGGVGKKADAEKQLPPSGAEVSEARGAVAEPQSEIDAKAKQKQVATLATRAAPSPEIEKLCTRIQSDIRNKRPPDEDAIKNADPKQKAKEVGQQLNTNVSGDADRVKGEYQGLDKPPAGAATKPAQPVKQTPPPQDTGQIKAEDAAPDKVPEEQVSLDKDVDANEKKMKDAGMMEEPAKLAKKGDQGGPLAKAHAAKGELKTAAQDDKKALLQKQDTAIASAKSDMAALQAKAIGMMTETRTATVGGNEKQQGDMVGSEEQMRAQVSQQAEQIYSGAQSKVTQLLQPLSQTAMSMWDAGIEKLSSEFKDSLAAVKKEVDERHDGILGGLVSAWDSLVGLPSHITSQYDRAEQKFGDGVCKLLREISTSVNNVIMSAEKVIADAREQIDNLFKSLPENLQGWAQQQQQQFDERLDGLNQKVQSTRNDFNKQLTQRANAAVNEVRQEVHALREKAKGLVGKIADAIGQFMENPAKFIINGLLKLVSIPVSSFWAVVNKIGSAINDIAKDPVKFGGNLLNALKQGFQRFFDNIGTHLMNGMLSWLFKGLNAAGVTVPKDFSLPSIISFFLQVLGISWSKIKQMIAKKLGISNIGLIEQAWSMISDLIQKGPLGLFELIQDKLNPQEILNTILQTAIDFLKETLITKVAMRIIGMMNPAGAILQAIEAIYKVLKWLFEKASSIFSLVETVVGGIGDILAGNIGGMAGAIEKALSKLLPIVIDFLADLLGLGGLPEKVADAIKGIQKTIESALESVINFVVDKAKALFKKLGFGKQEAKGEKKTSAAENKEASWSKKRYDFSDEDGDAHTVFFKGAGANAKLMVASEHPSMLEEMLATNYKGTDDEKDAKAALAKIKEARKLQKQVVKLDASTDAEKKKKKEEALDKALQEVVALLRKLDITGGQNDYSKEPSKVTFASAGGLPKTVTGNPITLMPGNTVGSEASGRRSDMERGNALLNALNGAGETWVRAHLLNNHLHGPADRRNLVGAPGTVNTSMSASVEEPAKEVVKKGGAIKYVASVPSYFDGPISGQEDTSEYPHSDQVKYIPRSIDVEWHELEKDGSGWKKKEGGKSKSDSFPIGQPSVPKNKDNRENLNNMGGTKLKAVVEANAGDASVSPIVDAIRDEREAGGLFASPSDFQSRMKGVINNQLKARLAQLVSDDAKDNAEEEYGERKDAIDAIAAYEEIIILIEDKRRRRR